MGGKVGKEAEEIKKRIGVAACRRMGVWAYGRMGVWAYRRANELNAS